MRLCHNKNDTCGSSCQWYANIAGKHGVFWSISLFPAANFLLVICGISCNTHLWPLLRLLQEQDGAPVPPVRLGSQISRQVYMPLICRLCLDCAGMLLKSFLTFDLEYVTILLWETKNGHHFVTWSDFTAQYYVLEETALTQRSGPTAWPFAS